MPQYSVIIPVFNRPDETAELLVSLANQDLKNFEVILIEDGSTEKSKHLVEQYADTLNIRYFYKRNTGPGDSRNFGMQEAKGDWLLFFDSDCIIPKSYFSTLEKNLKVNPPDAYGGPDAAHESFSATQKAINYAMTSFFTTGGIRGGKKQMNKFQPRSFNMGMTKKVYEKVGGFCDMHPGEDPELSFRILDAGFKTGLIQEAFVYHKRRIDFKKYANQVYKFGLTRVILNKWYPHRKSPVFYLPTLFLLGNIFLLLAAFLHPAALLPLPLFGLLIFLDSGIKTKSLPIAVLSVGAAFVQLMGYGWGFLISSIKVNLLRMEERKAFPFLFFGKK